MSNTKTRAGASQTQATARATSRNKMSEVLLDVAEPLVHLMSLPDDLEAYRGCLSLCSAIWNASRMNETEARRKAVASIVAALISENSSSAHDAQQMVGAVYLRARQSYANDKRLIEEVTVEHLGGDQCEVLVKSAELR